MLEILPNILQAPSLDVHAAANGDKLVAKRLLVLRHPTLRSLDFDSDESAVLDGDAVW